MSDGQLIPFPREKRDPKWIERLCLELIAEAKIEPALSPDAVNRIVQRIGVLGDELFKPVAYPCMIPAGLSPMQIEQFKQACSSAVRATLDEIFERVFLERVTYEVRLELGKGVR